MNRPLVVIFAAIGLDAVGIGLIFPILPRLLEDVTHTQNIAPYIGIMTALYAVMQFIFAPVLGALSDNLGRRPVLLISLAGAAINYVVMAFAPQLWMLLLGRAIAGLTSANVSVATAYITDISPEDKRARRFGLFNAMFGIGFIIGPVLGGVLGDYWLRLPFIAAAVLNACNLLLALFILPESRTPARQKIDLAALNPLRPLRWVFSMKGLLPIILVFFILSAAGEAYGTCWALWGFDTFHWNGLWIGLSLGTFGVCHTLVQVLLPGPATKLLGERRAVVVGIAWLMDNPEIPERLAKIMPRVEAKGGFTIRTLNMKDFKKEIKRFNELYNQFEQMNAVFTPMTPAEIEMMANDLKMVAGPGHRLLCRGGRQDGRRVTHPAGLQRGVQGGARPPVALRHLPPPHGQEEDPPRPHPQHGRTEGLPQPGDRPRVLLLQLQERRAQGLPRRGDVLGGRGQRCHDQHGAQARRKGVPQVPGLRARAVDGGRAAGACMGNDAVFLNGRFLTMEPSAPEATAVAVRGGRFVYVGDDAGARAALRGPGARWRSTLAADGRFPASPTPSALQMVRGVPALRGRRDRHAGGGRGPCPGARGKSPGREMDHRHGMEPQRVGRRARCRTRGRWTRRRPAIPWPCRAKAATRRG